MFNTIYSFITKKLFPNLGLGLAVVSMAGLSGFAAIKLANSVPTPNSVVSKVNQIKNVVNGNGSNKPSSGKPTNTSNTPVNSNQCIITLDSNKYDVTSLRKTHSGGDVFVCGTDMSNLYHSVHGFDLTRMQPYLIQSNGSASNNNMNSTSVTTSSSNGNTMTLAQLATHNTSSSCYVAYNRTVYDVSHNPAWSGCSHHGVTGGQDITSIFPHPTSYLSSLPVVGTLQGGSTATGNNVGRGLDDDSGGEDDRIEFDYNFNNSGNNPVLSSVNNNGNIFTIFVSYIRHLFS